jgi:DNA-directed RNA polymerase subunit RPC12/RpoP
MAKIEYDLKNFVYDGIIKECNEYALIKRQIDYLSYVLLQWKNNPPRLDPNGEITPTFEERINNEILFRTILLDNGIKIQTEVSRNKSNSEYCEWEDKGSDDYDTWYETQCGRSFYFSDGSNCEGNKFLYCPYCGKRILTKIHK